MSKCPLPTRRVLLGAGIAALAGSGAGAANSRRVAALGWAGAQTLMALGVEPIAMPEIERYNRLAVEPPAPPGCQELGLRSEPNLELLGLLNPDLIVTEAGTNLDDAVLEKIAPVEMFETIAQGRSPFDVAREKTLSLAARLGRTNSAVRYITDVDARVAAAASKLAGYRGKPLCLASEILGNRVLVFGAGSIYQSVLDKLGIYNAFTGATSDWGHATIGLDLMASMPAETRLVILNSRVASVRALLAYRPIIRALPMIREDRVTILPEILFYGGLPAADRFARLLAEGLPLGADERG